MRTVLAILYLTIMSLLVPPSAVAQNATSIWGIPITPPPPNIFAPDPPPGGDTADGTGLFIDPSTGTINWLQPHLAHGPSALGENVPIALRAWTMLAGGIDAGGFRPGLASYPPRGVWELHGRVVLVGPSNTEYNAIVTQGTQLSPDPARAGFLTEQRIIVGGGVQTSPPTTGGGIGLVLLPDGTVRGPTGNTVGQLLPDGTLRPMPDTTILGQLQVNGTVVMVDGTVVYPGLELPAGTSRPFTIPFTAPIIQCPAAYGQACEVLVWVYAKTDTPGAVALSIIGPDETGGGGVPLNYVSSLNIWRMRRPNW